MQTNICKNKCKTNNDSMRSKTKHYLKWLSFVVKTSMATNSAIFLVNRTSCFFVRRQVDVSVAFWAAMQNNVVTTSRSLGLAVEIVDIFFHGSGRRKLVISSNKFVTHEV